MCSAFGFLFFMMRVLNERVRVRRPGEGKPRTPVAKQKARMEAGAGRPRGQKGQYGLTLSFQQAESQSEPGQATRKKKKGKSREPQLALQTWYHTGDLLQDLFLSCDTVLRRRGSSRRQSVTRSFFSQEAFPPACESRAATSRGSVRFPDKLHANKRQTFFALMRPSRRRASPSSRLFHGAPHLPSEN